MSIRVWFVLVGVLISWHSEAQHAAWLEADLAVHDLFRRTQPATPEDFLAVADSLLALGPEGCTDRYVEQVMRLNGWALQHAPPPSDWKERTAPTSGCNDQCARHAYLKGALHYRLNEWSQAVEAFRNAAALSQDSTFRHEALNNLSAAFEKRGDPADSVYYALEQALRFANTQQSPYILNNLAALEISRNELPRAKQFLDRISSHSGALEANLLFNVNLNQLALAIASNDRLRAVQAHAALDTLEVTPGNGCKFARLVARYFLMMQDFEGYCTAYPKLQGFAKACNFDESSWAYERMLFQPTRANVLESDSLEIPVELENWSMIAWLHQQGAHFRVPESAAVEELLVESPPHQPFAQVPWMIALLSTFLTLGLFVQQKRLTAQKVADNLVTRKRLRKGLNELRHQIQSVPSATDLEQVIDQLESEWLEQPASATLQQAHPELELSPIEDEVLHLLSHGRSSKEIARIMDLSVSYVYNIRGRLRKKLDVPDGEDFDAWIAKRFGVQ